MASTWVLKAKSPGAIASGEAARKAWLKRERAKKAAAAKQTEKMQAAPAQATAPTAGGGGHEPSKALLPWHDPERTPMFAVKPGIHLEAGTSFTTEIHDVYNGLPPKFKEDTAHIKIFGIKDKGAEHARIARLQGQDTDFLGLSSDAVSTVWVTDRRKNEVALTLVHELAHQLERKLTKKEWKALDQAREADLEILKKKKDARVGLHDMPVSEWWAEGIGAHVSRSKRDMDDLDLLMPNTNALVREYANKRGW